MDQNRTPAGVPTGGRFAAQGHSEAEVAIDDDHWTWDNIADVVGEAHAAELKDRFDGSLGRAAAVADREWGEVTSSYATRQRLMDRGFKPSDFTSDNRDLRMSACAARGDLVFDGELLSDAYRVGAHSDVAGPAADRVVHPPLSVTVGDEEREWAHLPTSSKLAYIDGYASFAEGAEGADWRTDTIYDSGPGPAIGPLTDDDWIVRRAGWTRALDVASFERAANDGGIDRQVAIIDGGTIGKAVTLGDVTVEKLPNGHRQYRGVTAYQSLRYNPDGGTIVRPAGTPMVFAADAYLWDEQP